MSAFVEECRREWKRLGVPDSIADDMAAELTADLAEASADGVSEAELLGESDPRRFAASWASARGLALEEPPQPRRRRRLWWILAAVLALFVGAVVAGALLAAVGTGTGTATVLAPVKVGPPPHRKPVSVPLLAGLKEAKAVALARARGLRVTVVSVPHHRAGIVVAQAPVTGTRVQPGSTVLLRVGTGG